MVAYTERTPSSTDLFHQQGSNSHPEGLSYCSYDSLSLRERLTPICLCGEIHRVSMLKPQWVSLDSCSVSITHTGRLERICFRLVSPGEHVETGENYHW